MKIIRSNYDRQTRGFVQMCSIDPETGQIVHMDNVIKNTILYGSADIIAAAVSGDARFKISAIYFEFTNNPAKTIPVTVERDSGLEYYLTLDDQSDVIRSSITVTPNIASSDGDLYTGNQVTFFAATSSAVGLINGLNFGSDYDSEVYGVGLVATPSWSNHLTDRIFARVYFDDKKAKESAFEIGCLWLIRFR